MDWGVPALMNSVADPSYRDLCCYGAGIAGQCLSLSGCRLASSAWAHATSLTLSSCLPVVRPEREPGILLGFLFVFPFGFWNWSPGLGQLSFCWVPWVRDWMLEACKKKMAEFDFRFRERLRLRPLHLPTVSSPSLSLSLSLLTME